MRKIILTITMILLFLGSAIAGDYIYEKEIYIGSPDCTIETDDWGPLVEIPMDASAGYLLDISCESDESDDFVFYLLDEELENPTTNADLNKISKQVFYKDNSTSNFSTKPDIYPFVCNDNTKKRSLFMIIYNDDTVSANFRSKLKYIPMKKNDYSVITATE